MQQNRYAPPRQNSGYGEVQNEPAQMPVQSHPGQGFHPENRPQYQNAPRFNRPMDSFQHEQPSSEFRRHQKEPETGKSEQSKKPADLMQLNSYGSKAALQVQTSMTKEGWHTIFVESAIRENPNDPSNKRYLWNNKTVFQITQSELPIFVAVMLGMLESVRFDNHGDTSKWLEITNQGKNFYFRSGQKDANQKALPFPVVDAFQFGTMALAQYCKNFHNLTTEAGLMIIAKLADQLHNYGAYNRPKPRGQ